jgi:hypothetical protein
MHLTTPAIDQPSQQGQWRWGSITMRSERSLRLSKQNSPKATVPTWIQPPTRGNPAVQTPLGSCRCGWVGGASRSTRRGYRAAARYSLHEDAAGNASSLSDYLPIRALRTTRDDPSALSLTKRSVPQTLACDSVRFVPIAILIASKLFSLKRTSANAVLDSENPLTA